MGRRNRKNNRRRQEKEVIKTPNWSNLPQDLLRCVFERLSFTSLNRVKLVCSWWYSASKGCVPSQNQIPWLILFSPEKNKKKKKNRCMFFVPEDQEILYGGTDFGVEFARSHCMTTCGSWFLLMNTDQNLYILNPLTGDRIDLPNIQSFETIYINDIACFWIDNKTKDYLVVMTGSKRFTKNGFNSWENLDCKWFCQDVFYNDKTKKLYLHVIDMYHNEFVDIWDFSRDMPSLDVSVSLPWFHYDKQYVRQDEVFCNSNMVFTVSGDFSMIRRSFHEPWYFSIFKLNEEDHRWEQTNSLGDQALIYGLSTTVIANDSIPGIKRNFSNNTTDIANGLKDIFVYDLTTHQVEPLPQCVLSSIPFFTKAQWFFPY